jgi:Uma2 family endonuclease
LTNPQIADPWSFGFPAVWEDTGAMATLPAREFEEPLVTVEEYLHTSYQPDCDYVDGHIEERNVGEYDHGYLQTLLAVLFTNNRDAWSVRAVTDVRTQVKATRFRCPDVSVLRRDAPREPILTHPQLIAIEILSPEDRISRMQVKIDDYLAFGVENIWIFDPETRRAWIADHSGLHLIQNNELTVAGTPIRVVLGELFAELDRA